VSRGMPVYLQAFASSKLHSLVKGKDRALDIAP